MADIHTVGIITSQTSLPAWQISVFERFIQCNPNIVLYSVKTAPAGFNKSVTNRIHQWLSNTVFRIEGIFHGYHPDAFKQQNLISTFPGLKELNFKTDKETGKMEYFIPGGVLPEFDVIISFEEIPDMIELVTKTKLGIWKLNMSDFANESFSATAGYREVLFKSGMIRSSLVVYSGLHMDQTIVLDTWSMADHSLIESLNNHYWKSINLIFRYLSEIENGNHPSKRIDLYTPPKKKVNIMLHIILIMRYLKNRILYKIKKICFHRKWFILIAKNKTKGGLFKGLKFNIIHSPKGKFWADPFLLEDQGCNYLFLEEFEYNTQKAHISVCHLKGDCIQPVSAPVLETSYHLSYPFIIKDGGHFYMIPESSANRTIDLYKCRNFPYAWEHIRTLKQDVSAVDTTIYFKDDLYWMFTCIKEKNVKWNYDELHLFYSDCLDGDRWISHPMNPVVSDTRSARPAGRIFTYGESLYRPAQFCGYKYGNGLIINKITTLTKDVYAEESVDFADAAGDLIRKSHTLAWNDNYIIIDSLKKVLKPLA